MPIVPADQSPYEWANEHRTVGTTLDKYFTAYNPTSPLNRGLSAMETLRTAARELEQLLKDARSAKKHFRAQGAGWALNDLAMTMPNGWMLWTTNLNGHWEVGPVHRHPKYSAAKLKNLVLCQGGATVGKLNEYLETEQPIGAHFRLPESEMARALRELSQGVRTVRRSALERRPTTSSDYSW